MACVAFRPRRQSLDLLTSKNKLYTKLGKVLELQYSPPHNIRLSCSLNTVYFGVYAFLRTYTKHSHTVCNINMVYFLILSSFTLLAHSIYFFPFFEKKSVHVYFTTLCNPVACTLFSGLILFNFVAMK